MGARPFRYIAPSSYPELLAAATEFAADGKLLAGGQSLIPMLNLRLLRPEVVISVGEHLNGQIRSEDGHLAIPAGTRHADLVRHPLVRTLAPGLAEAARQIGNIRVRNRGTIGGSLAHADATAELPCILSALGARIVVASADRQREVPAEGFIVSWFTPALEPGELVREIRVPIRRAKQAFVEFSVRPGDFALAEVAVAVFLDSADEVVSARVAVGGVGERPILIETEPSALLRGQGDARHAATELGEVIAGAIEPVTDHRASGAYRRALVSVLVADAVIAAMSGGIAA